MIDQALFWSGQTLSIGQFKVMRLRLPALVYFTELSLGIHCVVAVKPPSSSTVPYEIVAKSSENVGGIIHYFCSYLSLTPVVKSQ